MKNALKRLGMFLGIVEDKRPKFNPNAIDRDGDGIVQEGTIYERPATPKPKAPVAKKTSTAKKSTSSPKTKKK
jgi:hypothetical protein